MAAVKIGLRRWRPGTSHDARRRAAPPAGARLRRRGAGDRDPAARRRAAQRAPGPRARLAAWSSRGRSRSRTPAATPVSGGPGLLAIFDPNERHEVARDRGRAPAAGALALARRGPPRAALARLSSSSDAQVALEARVADRGRLEAAHLDPLARGEPGDRAQHRQAVIAGGVERAAAQAAAAADDEAVRRSPRSRRRAPRSPSTTVAIRSDSLWRSSSAPETTVSPSAKQPASATSGSSSIASGTSPPPTRVARSGPERATIVATGSPPGGRGLDHLDRRPHPGRGSRAGRSGPG